MPTLTIALVAETQYGKIEHVLEEKTVILTFKGGFVPLDAFRELLAKVDLLVTTKKIEKMIFDKTSLKVFHQPSMEWYHLEWKTKMLTKGLKVYRKILPQDPLFIQSVQVGREKILKLNPYFDIKKFDIKYCKSLEEAFNL
jgi:hypothetical protein